MAKFVKAFLFGGPGAATTFGDIGLTIVRVASGAMMAGLHGWQKVWVNGGFGPPDYLVDSAKSMGFPIPMFFAVCAVLAEFLGGILLALGLFTRPAAILIAMTMSTAAFVHHAGDTLADKERALLFLSAAILFLFVGGGKYSADRFLR